MKSIIKELLYDRYMVRRLKKANASEGVLYQNLISGKITLQEYLAAL
jgi:hypothetical protein